MKDNHNNNNSNNHHQSYSSCSFHPDGLILGIGTSSGELKVWDIREPKHVTDLKDANSSSNSNNTVQSLSFSENGYLSAAGYASGEVKIWDLRKLTCVKSFQCESIVFNLWFD
jgi:pre-mRNA-processing factor 19